MSVLEVFQVFPEGNEDWEKLDKEECVHLCAQFTRTPPAWAAPALPVATDARVTLLPSPYSSS